MKALYWSIKNIQVLTVPLYCELNLMVELINDLFVHKNAIRVSFKLCTCFLNLWSPDSFFTSNKSTMITDKTFYQRNERIRGRHVEGIVEQAWMTFRFLLFSPRHTKPPGEDNKVFLLFLFEWKNIYHMIIKSNKARDALPKMVQMHVT